MEVEVGEEEVDAKAKLQPEGLTLVQMSRCPDYPNQSLDFHLDCQ